MTKTHLLAATVAFVFAQQATSALLPVEYNAQVVYTIEDVPILIQNVGAGVGQVAAYSGCLVSTVTQQSCGSSFALAGLLGNQSTIGELHPNTIPGWGEGTYASSWFRDILTVSGLGAGSYTIVPTVTVHGTVTWDHVALPGTVGVAVQEWGPDGTTLVADVDFDGFTPQNVFSTTLSLPGIQFQDGVPFNLMLGFGEIARIFNGDPASENSLVNADFLSTMRITHLDVFDANGAPVTGFAIASASGALYGPNGVTIPEPTTLALLGLGLAGLAASRRRKQ